MDSPENCLLSQSDFRQKYGTEKESLVIAGYVIRTMILRSGRIAHHFSFPLLRAEEKKFNSTLTSEKKKSSIGTGMFLVVVVFF